MQNELRFDVKFNEGKIVVVATLTMDMAIWMTNDSANKQCLYVVGTLFGEIPTNFPTWVITQSWQKANSSTILPKKRLAGTWIVG
jgi:hypothetical protein